MLTWKKIKDFIKNGVPAPENKVIQTEEEWRKLLSDDVFFITTSSVFGSYSGVGKASTTTCLEQQCDDKCVLMRCVDASSSAPRV